MEKLMVYLKTEQSVAVRRPKVRLKDIAVIYCVDPETKCKLEKMEVLRFAKQRDDKQVISVLKLVQMMQKEEKCIEVQNVGETDTIVYYHCPKPRKEYLQNMKIVFVCLIVFFGAAITIMSYNNDVDIKGVFSGVYELFTGISTKEPTLIHLFYSLGLAVGVLVFFNHILKKRLTDDPTPFEVQMRLYERDVNDTFIISAGRKEEEQDVD